MTLFKAFLIEWLLHRLQGVLHTRLNMFEGQKSGYYLHVFESSSLGVT